MLDLDAKGRERARIHVRRHISAVIVLLYAHAWSRFSGLYT